MIPKPSLHIHVLGVPRRTRLQIIRRLLERRIQTAPGLPPKGAACTSSPRISADPTHSHSDGKWIRYRIEEGKVRKHTLPSLILRKFSGHFVELGSVAQLL